MLKQGKFTLLMEEIKQSGLNITGLSEVRWSSSGHFEYDGYFISYCRAEKGGYGGEPSSLIQRLKNLS